MATNAKIKTDIQHLNVGSALIHLYTLDATSIEGGGTYHFCPMTDSGDAVLFNSVEYLPLPVETEGFMYDGTGAMPRPLIRVSNINLTFVAAVVSFNDLVGAKLTRRRTFAKYLDGASEANPSAQFPTDIFYIERKTRQNKYLIEWELKAAVDIENTLIPRRQVLGICSHRYRLYKTSTGTFDYTNASCPYTSTSYFDAEGVVTTKANDKCGKKLFDCQLRYGTDQLPGRFFPGVGKLGTPWR